VRKLKASSEAAVCEVPEGHDVGRKSTLTSTKSRQGRNMNLRLENISSLRDSLS